MKFIYIILLLCIGFIPVLGMKVNESEITIMEKEFFFFPMGVNTEGIFKNKEMEGIFYFKNEKQMKVNF